MLLVSESSESPSTRYRLEPLARWLRDSGLEVVEATAGSGAASRMRIKELAVKARSVVLQRRLWSLFDVAALRRCCRRLIYDIDDAVCYADGSKGRFFSVARLMKFRALCRRADLVVAGNDYLASLAKRHGARETAVVPTCLPRVPAPATHDGNGRLLVWIGGPATRRYLETFAPVLRELAAESGDITLRVVADRLPNLSGVRCELVPWSRDREWKALATADIGIAPLPSDRWTRGKCGLKLLQYGAAGLPAIASPVGVQREIIADGENGYLANDMNGWKEALARLVADATLRRRLGEAARRRVKERYSWQQAGPTWRELLRGI